MTPQDALDALLGAILVGADRRPFESPAVDGAAGALLDSIAEETGELRLLHSAAMLTLHARAGRRPDCEPSLAPTSSAYDAPKRCSEQASILLAIILDGEHVDLLGEWLALAEESGTRPPEEYIPMLLDRGKADPSIRQAIVRATGHRGAWLAARNPDWEYASPNLDPNIWQNGTRSRRRELLVRIRRRSPDEGLALVSSTWNDETADTRLSLIQALAEGLCRNDEEFLERALDDERKEVRLSSLDLLSRIESSRLAGRMGERCGRMVGFDRAADRFTIHLADQSDENERRDGLEGLSDRERFIRIAGAAPLKVWSEIAQGTPDDLVDWAGRSENGELLIMGWMAGALRKNQSDWAGAIVRAANGEERIAGDEELILLIEPTERDRIVSQLVANRSKELAPGDRLYRLLASLPAPWSADLGLMVLEVIAHLSSDQTSAPWRWLMFLDRAALGIDPGLADRAASILKHLDSRCETWRAPLKRFATTLALRGRLRNSMG